MAAEKLYVTQSTVSARIKALEDQLNRKLFVRKRTGIELTSGGQRFYPHAITVVQAWERARQEVALPEGLKAMVSLGTQLNHWDYIAAPWLAWMQRNAPDVATQVEAEYSESLMRKLRDGLLEVAILYDPQYCPGVTIESFTNEELIMVSTEPREVSQGPVPGYVFVDWGDSFRTQHSLAFPDTPTHKLSISIGAVGLDHILKQGGSGYFTLSMVRELLDSGQLYRVKDAPVFERPLYLGYQEEPQNEALLDIAIQGIRAVIQ